MSATLAVLLKELDPSLTLEVVELMDSGAAESSNPWNNAGTGHAGLCELNYTPQAADGSIDIKKAVHINTQFEVSKQFWSYMTKKGTFGSSTSFISPVPHLSFVQGEDGVSFLKARFEAMHKHHAFSAMEYTEDKAKLAEWMPLMMPGRPADEPIAATRVMKGTDVNFGALTNQLLKHLSSTPDAQVKYCKRVTGLTRKGQGWSVSIKDVNTGNTREVDAKFVFLGAGGAALPLLQMSGVEESKGFGGFPVSANGCVAITRKWSSITRPRCTARPRWVRHPCRSRIWTPALSMARRPCCLAHTPVSPPSSSSTVHSWTCHCRCVQPTLVRCWR